MTGWTLFFVLVGAAFLTAQLFRLIDLIERPARRTTACRKSQRAWLGQRARLGQRVRLGQRARLGLPEAWNVRLWDALDEKQWTFWRS